MGSDTKISIRPKENVAINVAIIDITGEVTALTSEAIEEAYQQISSKETKTILLAFDKECYINSGGIATLISIASESQENGQTVYVTGLSDHFHKIFDMVGLTQYMTIFPSEEAALKGL